MARQRESLEANALAEISRLERVMARQRKCLEADAEDKISSLARETARQRERLEAGARAKISSLMKDMAQQRESFRRDVDALQAKIDAYESQLREAQLRSFADMARTQYTDEEDSTIIQDIKFLHQNIWTWAKANCLPQIEDVRVAVGEEHNSAVIQRLEIAGVDTSLLAPSQPVSLKKLPALILAAVVAEDIYQSMFCNPFFFLDSICPDTAYNKQEALNEIFELLNKCRSLPHELSVLFIQVHGVCASRIAKKILLTFMRCALLEYISSSGDPHEAVHWRAQLLRIVHPLRHTSSSHPAPPSEIARATENGIAWTCDGLVLSFLSGPGGRLLGHGVSTSNQQLQQLRQCYVQAGRLFTRLHAQTLELWCPQAPILGQPYNPRTMQPHPLHGSFDDGQEHLLVERRVVLVVSPLLQKITRSDGRVHSTVLVKAVVCLDL